MSISKSDVIVVDTETNTGAIENRLTDVHAVGLYLPDTDEIIVTVEPERIQSYLNGRMPIFHNSVFDVWVLRSIGVIVPEPWADTMVMSYIVSPDRPSHSLASLAEEFGSFKLEAPDYDEGCTDKLVTYLHQDLRATWAVFTGLIKQVEGLRLHSISKLEHRFLPALTELNHNGVYINKGVWEPVLTELREKQEEVLNKILSIVSLVPGRRVKTKKPRTSNVTTEDNLIEGHFIVCPDEPEWTYQKVEKFNPGSVKHKEYALRHLYGWQPTQLTQKGNVKIDSDVLSELDYPLAKLLNEYAEVAKLLNTYGSSLLDQVHDNGRLYANFNGTVTRTGRLSSSKPNLQNIPGRGEMGSAIRSMFAAPPGRVLVSIDVDQFQLRILAWYLFNVLGNRFPDARVMFDDFNKESGSDPHQVTADLLGVERKVGKTLNFAELFGAGVKKLAATLDMSQREVKRILAVKAEAQPSVAALRHWVLNEARTHGCEVITLYGRRGHYPELLSDDFGERAHAERQAFNFLIQGTEADIIKLMVTEAYKRLNMSSKLVLQVHDEFTVECDEEDAEDTKNILNGVVNRDIWLPGLNVTGSASVGYNWAEVH